MTLHIDTSIYIYKERERERKKETDMKFLLATTTTREEKGGEGKCRLFKAEQHINEIKSIQYMCVRVSVKCWRRSRRYILLTEHEYLQDNQLLKQEKKQQIDVKWK